MSNTLKVLMITNTYLPHVGGVARSVERFRQALADLGHEVRVIAPAYGDATESTEDVWRVPAIQDFRGSGFSVSLPGPMGELKEPLKRFHPDIIHAHHPFLLGNTALRLGATHKLPVVFTHHTMYEKYTHYFLHEHGMLDLFVTELSRRYANMCDQVIAPSESVALYLETLGVNRPISVVPTGVEVDRFADGDRNKARQQQGIPEEATVFGHVGRLAHEKNLVYLAEALSKALKQRSHAHALIVGDGPARESMEDIFKKAGVAERVHFSGILKGGDLTNAYHAMDLFAFSSLTETQGMVIVEAMAAGLPVVALDGPGVREVIDGQNGRLLSSAEPEDFAAAAVKLSDENADTGSASAAARRIAESYSTKACVHRLVDVYRSAMARSPEEDWDTNVVTQGLRRMEREWELLFSSLSAAIHALL